MRVIGLMIRLMEMECTYMLMGPGMMDSGRTICKMGWAKKLGTMVQTMMGSISRVRNRDGAYTSGTMGHSTKGFGRKTRLRGKGPTSG